MGWHNRITIEQFERIKACIKEHIDDYLDLPVWKVDAMVAKECKVGKTTATHARLSQDYEAYCKRTKGKYWWASEQPKEKPDLPQMQIKKRDVAGGVNGVKEAATIQDGDITIRIIVERSEK